MRLYRWQLKRNSWKWLLCCQAIFHFQSWKVERSFCRPVAWFFKANIVSLFKKSSNTGGCFRLATVELFTFACLTVKSRFTFLLTANAERHHSVVPPSFRKFFHSESFLCLCFKYFQFFDGSIRLKNFRDAMQVKYRNRFRWCWYMKVVCSISLILPGK